MPGRLGRTHHASHTHQGRAYVGRMPWAPSLKGSNTTAQGNALGRGDARTRPALKGRHKHCGTNDLWRPFRAFGAHGAPPTQVVALGCRIEALWASAQWELLAWDHARTAARTRSGQGHRVLPVVSRGVETYTCQALEDNSSRSHFNHPSRTSSRSSLDASFGISCVGGVLARTTCTGDTVDSRLNPCVQARTLPSSLLFRGCRAAPCLCSLFPLHRARGRRWPRWITLRRR